MINPWKDNDEIINILQCTVKSYSELRSEELFEERSSQLYLTQLIHAVAKRKPEKNSGRRRGSRTRVDWNGERIYRHSFLLCFLNKYHQTVRHDAYLPLWLKKKSSLQAMELLIRTSATYMSSTFWSRKLAFLKVNIYISLEIFQWPFCHVAFVAFISVYQSALLLNFAIC